MQDKTPVRTGFEVFGKVRVSGFGDYDIVGNLVWGLLFRDDVLGIRVYRL